MVLVVLALLTQTAYAIPKLGFSGGVDFNSNTDILSVNGGVLISHEDLSVTPALFGSTLDFSVMFNRPTDLSTMDTGFFIVSEFSGVGAGPHITITADTNNDNINETILAGNFVDFMIKGVKNQPIGIVTATIDVTAGISDFFSNSADLFALEINLFDQSNNPLNFNTEIYNQNFTATMNGDITSTPKVPEPNALILFSLGLLLITGFRKKLNAF